MAFMTQKLIPLFLERKQRCALINLSSQSVALTLKTLSVYTGTKAFNALFSQCLTQDYLGMNIVVQMKSIFSTVLQQLSRQLGQDTPNNLFHALLSNALDGH